MEWETLPFFISDHEGFHGTIKNSPKDFVVTEIDTHGQLVTNPNIQGTQTKTVYQGTIKDVKSKQTQPDEIDISNQDCFDLNDILNPSVCKELEHFTDKIRAKTSPSKGEQENMELSLGTFADKNLRAVVHRAVRQTFPFLQTVTNQSEIRVREDQDFKKLSKLSSEGEAEEFFRFIDAKAPGCVFTFLPDHSKEHRTSVHHFVSLRFGKLVETKSFTDQNKTYITVRLRDKSKQPKKREIADCQEEEVTYTGKQRLVINITYVLSCMQICLRHKYVCPQLSHCKKRTWRHWRPSATWLWCSECFRPILPMQESKTRKQ